MAKSILPVTYLDTLPALRGFEPDRELEERLADFHKKIVVLDDDPTGVQTVHDISVYTDWTADSLRAAFAESNNLFFVLTNSRGFTESETVAVHETIAQNLAAVAEETGKDFVVISRSDSTLRGHFPVETETLRTMLESLTGRKYSGEVVMPSFLEGGRYTLWDIHYVRTGDVLVPAGDTEFAQDKTFGYRASHLGEWCEEKTQGAYAAQDMTYISIEELRVADIGGITKKLEDSAGFNKIIVNAASYEDVKVFVIALLDAMARGYHYMIRSGASIVKVIGGVPDKPLLTRKDLVEEGNTNGGIVLIGSHVNKTTRQLEVLQNAGLPVELIEFDQHRVLQPGGLAQEVDQVVAKAERFIAGGRSVVIYTRRERLDLPQAGGEEQLRISVEISNAVTSIIGKLNVRPAFIIAKGGITSSDVGTKALGVRRATVMGQIQKGIPVWMTGEESKFPGMPYVIFPGNVGEDTSLREMIEQWFENP